MLSVTVRKLYNIIMKFRQSLFWDTDPKQLNIQRHATYIIERIMDFGKDDDVRWMKKTYPKSLLYKVSQNSRVLHPSSKTLWQLMTKI